MNTAPHPTTKYPLPTLSPEPNPLNPSIIPTSHSDPPNQPLHLLRHIHKRKSRSIMYRIREIHLCHENLLPNLHRRRREGSHRIQHRPQILCAIPLPVLRSQNRKPIDIINILAHQHNRALVLLRQENGVRAAQRIGDIPLARDGDFHGDAFGSPHVEFEETRRIIVIGDQPVPRRDQATKRIDGGAKRRFIPLIQLRALILDPHNVSREGAHDIRVSLGVELDVLEPPVGPLIGRKRSEIEGSRELLCGRVVVHVEVCSGEVGAHGRLEGGGVVGDEFEEPVVGVFGYSADFDFRVIARDAWDRDGSGFLGGWVVDCYGGVVDGTAGGNRGLLVNAFLEFGG